MSFKLPDSIASILDTSACPTDISSSQLVVALGLGALVCGYIFSPPQGPIRHGPGPKGLPILGNVTDLPKKDKHKVYADWAKKYGTLASLDFHIGICLTNRQATSSISLY
jgi:hypothetical protein